MGGKKDCQAINDDLYNESKKGNHGEAVIDPDPAVRAEDDRCTLAIQMTYQYQVALVFAGWRNNCRYILAFTFWNDPAEWIIPEAKLQ